MKIAWVEEDGSARLDLGNWGGSVVRCDSQVGWVWSHYGPGVNDAYGDPCPMTSLHNLCESREEGMRECNQWLKDNAFQLLNYLGTDVRDMEKTIDKAYNWTQRCGNVIPSQEFYEDLFTRAVVKK